MTLIELGRNANNELYGNCTCVDNLFEKDLRCFKCHYTCLKCNGINKDECTEC